MRVKKTIEIEINSMHEITKAYEEVWDKIAEDDNDTWYISIVLERVRGTNSYNHSIFCVFQVEYEKPEPNAPY